MRILDKAIEKYDQSLKIFEELGDKGGIGSTMGQMERIYEAKEDYKEALRNYIICLSIFESLGSPDKKQQLMISIESKQRSAKKPLTGITLR